MQNLGTDGRRQHRPQSRSCAYCGSTSDRCRLKLCSGCSLVRYCSTEHQRAHWPEHKASCNLERPTSSPTNRGTKNAANASTSRTQARQTSLSTLQGSRPTADSESNAQTSETMDLIRGTPAATTPAAATATATANAARASSAPRLEVGWGAFSHPDYPPPPGAVLSFRLLADPAPVSDFGLQHCDFGWGAFAVDVHGEIGTVGFKLRNNRFDRPPLSSMRAGTLLHWTHPRVILVLNGSFGAQIEDDDLINIVVVDDRRSTSFRGNAPRRRAAATSEQRRSSTVWPGAERCNGDEDGRWWTYSPGCQAQPAHARCDGLSCRG